MGVHKYFLTEKLEGSPLRGVWGRSFYKQLPKKWVKKKSNQGK